VLTTLLALGLSAQAAKIPVTVNIGIGPTIGTVGTTGGLMAPSLGLGLQLEGWVSKKTLRSKKVRRRVPKQYRGMVRGMDDLHARPLPTWVVPDTALIAPLQEGPAVRGASWAPISVALSHRAKAKGPHWSLSVSPRIAWLNLSADGAETTNQGWYGASIDPDLQSNMKNTVGVAVAGSIGAGWTGEPSSAYGLDGRPWLMASGTVRLQIRVPIKIKL